MVGLSCFYIASKVNSLHFGGAEVLPLFYFRDRPRPQGLQVKGKVLAVYSKDIKTILTQELTKVEFEILTTLNF